MQQARVPGWRFLCPVPHLLWAPRARSQPLPQTPPPAGSRADRRGEKHISPRAPSSLDREVLARRRQFRCPPSGRIRWSSFPAARSRCRSQPRRIFRFGPIGPGPSFRHRLGENSNCETAQGQPARDSAAAVKLIADEIHGPHISGAHRYYRAFRHATCHSPSILPFCSAIAEPALEQLPPSMLSRTWSNACSQGLGRKPKTRSRRSVDKQEK